MDGFARGIMGWMDEEGYIYLAGRADDMIIRGGENISPEEVEDVLRSHPKVEEAAVIGVPDPEWGQEPRAVVVLKKGEQPLRGDHGALPADWPVLRGRGRWYFLIPCPAIRWERFSRKSFEKQLWSGLMARAMRN